VDVIEARRDDLQRVGNRNTYALGTIIKSHYSHLVKI